MNRNCLFIALAVSVLFFCGCATYVTGSDENSNILNMTTEDFDKEKATGMVLELEKPMLEFTDGDFIARENLEILQGFDIFSGDNGINPLYTLFDVAELDDPGINEFEIIGRGRYPTLADGNIEITKAYVVTLTYKDNTPPLIELHINEEPIDESDITADFLRDYIFRPNETEGWDFFSIEGIVNLPR